MSEDVVPPRPVGVAVAGCGALDVDFAEIFHGIGGCDLLRVYDVSEDALERVRRRFPHVETGRDLGAILDDPEVEAVVVGGAIGSRVSIARHALSAGKHVCVQEPLALTSADADRLLDEAKLSNRVLMTARPSLHDPAVQHLRRLIDRGQFGEIYYMYATRVALGPVRADSSVLWTLGPADISLLHHLMAVRPTAVSARGGAYLRGGAEDVVFLTLTYPDGRLGHLHMSWLDPVTTRSLTIVGSNRMAVLDEGARAGRLRIFDKGAIVSRDDASYGAFAGLRNGDVTSPWFEPLDAAKASGAHFLDCVRTGASPRSDGRDGIAVVRVLEAAAESLRLGGVPVEIVDA